MANTKVEINPEVMRKIARLARLKLSAEEEKLYAGELEKVLAYVDQLNSVNTDGVEPLVHGFPLEPHFREDEAIKLDEETTKRIVACSDQPLYEQFRVPQVIGGE